MTGRVEKREGGPSSTGQLHNPKSENGGEIWVWKKTDGAKG